MADGQHSGRLRPAHPPRTPLAEVWAAAGLDASAARSVGGGDAGDAADLVVTGVGLRAQDLAQGDLFAALPGSRRHGAEFAAEAIGRGAVAVFTDEEGAQIIGRSVGAESRVPLIVHDDPRAVLGEVSATVYGRPSRSVELIGITGTAGKTTTSYLVEAGLMAAGHRVGLIGTVETRIDGAPAPSALTTPEAPDLQALLAVMAERGVDTVVMEVSSHALALGRVDGCDFAVAGFTNLSQDHLDFHRDMDDYFTAKARLFSPGSGVRAAAAAVCVDDRWGRAMAELARAEPAMPTSTVAIAEAPDTGEGTDRDVDGPSGAAADWHAGPSEVDGTGVQHFTVRGPSGDEHPVTVPLPGRFNAANALLALAVLDAAGIAAEVAARGLAEVAVPGRLERVDRGQPFLAVVDYAHKPGALEAVIDTLRAQTPGRLAVVVGAGGDRDAKKRPLMGAVAARGAELVVITDDNPRTEDPGAIRAALLKGARGAPSGDGRRIIEVGDRAAAIDSAIAWARPGDTVLVAGKGHESGQQVGRVTHPFDDRDVVAAAIGRHAAPASRTEADQGTETMAENEGDE